MSYVGNNQKPSTVFQSWFLTHLLILMADNQEAPEIGHVTNLLAAANTSTSPTPLEFQQLIN